MEKGERENVYLVDAQKIADKINEREASLTSNFALWMKHGEFFLAQVGEDIPDGIHLYTGEGWESTENVDAEWVLNHIEVPES